MGTGQRERKRCNRDMSNGEGDYGKWDNGQWGIGYVAMGYGVVNPIHVLFTFPISNTRVSITTFPQLYCQTILHQSSTVGPKGPEEKHLKPFVISHISDAYFGSLIIHLMFSFYFYDKLYDYINRWLNVTITYTVHQGKFDN